MEIGNRLIKAQKLIDDLNNKLYRYAELKLKGRINEHHIKDLDNLIECLETRQPFEMTGPLNNTEIKRELTKNGVKFKETDGKIIAFDEYIIPGQYHDMIEIDVTGYSRVELAIWLGYVY